MTNALHALEQLEREMRESWKTAHEASVPSRCAWEWADRIAAVRAELGAKTQEDDDVPWCAKCNGAGCAECDFGVLPDEVEAVIACLGDDAAALRDGNDENEIAANMERAAELLERLALTMGLLAESNPPASAVAQGDLIAVPREPTYDMLRAVSESPYTLVDCDRGQCVGTKAPDHDEARAIWKAMLAAAPKAPK